VGAHSEHPGVLARAVAVDGARFLAAPEETGGRGGVHRLVGAALEVVLRETRLAQDGAHSGKVPRLATVGGAGNRELLARDPELVRRPGEDERQRLEGLGRGTQVYETLGVAQRVQRLPPRVAHYVAAAMDALDKLPTPDGGNRRIPFRSFRLGNLFGGVRGSRVRGFGGGVRQ
jgi:hypothetical protein